MYLILAQCEQVYLFLAISILLIVLWEYYTHTRGTTAATPARLVVVVVVVGPEWEFSPTHPPCPSLQLSTATHPPTHDRFYASKGIWLRRLCTMNSMSTMTQERWEWGAWQMLLSGQAPNIICHTLCHTCPMEEPPTQYEYLNAVRSFWPRPSICRALHSRPFGIYVRVWWLSCGSQFCVLGDGRSPWGKKACRLIHTGIIYIIYFVIL